MSLCSRCFGLYLFIILGAILSLIFGLSKNLNPQILFLLTLFLNIPLFFDSITQFFNLRESNNYLRFITGAVSGLILGIDIIYIFFHFFNNLL